MAEQLNFYDIVRTCKGTLSLDLPSYDMTAPKRSVSIPYNIQKTRVPRTFALGIFTDSTLEQMYKAGKFRVEPVKQFEAEVAEIFFPIENKVVAVPEEEIISMLKKGNRKGIKDLIANNEVDRDNIIIIARQNIEELPVSMVNDLNKILGVELQVEDASME